MDIKNAVIILGAGASKAAHTQSGHSPPLDQDLLETASVRFRNLRLKGKNRDCVRTWKAFKKQIISAGLHFDDVKHWKLEQLSTFLEARANLKGLQLGVGQPREYTRALELLNRVVAHVLQVTGGVETCALHRHLFQAAEPPAVISFNYDLIADQTLLDMRRLNWKRNEYTGGARSSIPLEGGGKTYKYFDASRQDDATRLIKLHGSMNWEEMFGGKDYRLSGVMPPEGRRRIFDYITVPERPYIVPPVAAKIQIKEGPLRSHWYQALDFLHDSSKWVIWGYSFPQTDTISQVLFRTALARNRKKKPVIVVNPDPTAAARVVTVCQKVRVEHYSSIESLLIKLGELRV